jgi:hypothetical protein
MLRANRSAPDGINPGIPAEEDAVVERVARLAWIGVRYAVVNCEERWDIAGMLAGCPELLADCHRMESAKPRQPDLHAMPTSPDPNSHIAGGIGTG